MQRLSAASPCGVRAVAWGDVGAAPPGGTAEPQETEQPVRGGEGGVHACMCERRLVIYRKPRGAASASLLLFYF